MTAAAWTWEHPDVKPAQLARYRSCVRVITRKGLPPGRAARMTADRLGAEWDTDADALLAEWLDATNDIGEQT